MCRRDRRGFSARSHGVGGCLDVGGAQYWDSENEVGLKKSSSRIWYRVCWRCDLDVDKSLSNIAKIGVIPFCLFGQEDCKTWFQT